MIFSTGRGLIASKPLVHTNITIFIFSRYIMKYTFSNNFFIELRHRQRTWQRWQWFTLSSFRRIYIYILVLKLFPLRQWFIGSASQELGLTVQQRKDEIPWRKARDRRRFERVEKRKKDVGVIVYGRRRRYVRGTNLEKENRY